jgi:hypothetical protein
MIRAEQIPDEAEEAAWNAAGDNMKAAIAAALSAWPGVTTENRELLNFGNNIDGPIVSAKRVPFLILPLPQEARDER